LAWCKHQLDFPGCWWRCLWAISWYRSTSIAALVVKVGAAGALILAGMLASVPLLAAAAFLVVSAEVAFDTSVHGSVVYLLSSQDRTRGNSALYSWQATTGQFLGPGLGGLLFAPLRYLAPLVSASLHAAALVPLAAGRPVPRRPRTGAVAQESLRAALLSGFRPLFADRGLRWTTLIGTISMLAYGLWTSTFVSYVTTRAGIDQRAWVFGVLMACPGVRHHVSLRVPMGRSKLQPPCHRGRHPSSVHPRLGIGRL